MAEWSDQYNAMRTNKKKHVADEMVDGKRVSTVWLGMDHSLFPSGIKPLIFETMVFDHNSEDIYCERYSTWHEALEGHAKAVKWVKDGCKDE